jgi:signal transduction histidine kinase
MSSISRPDPRTRATWRWGGAIAVVLVLQSLIIAGLFWALATSTHRRAAEAGFARDCRDLAALSPGDRVLELNAMIRRDIHRDRFLALFDPTGRLMAGNIAQLPATATPFPPSFVATIEPTRLPGKDRDVARAALCAMPDGTRLFTGVDLDDAEEALHVVQRSLLLGLIPGIAVALIFGLIVGRRAARQVDTVRRLTERIVAGGLGERLPVSDPPDSFDLLCSHINLMLDRLQVLIADVRFVGDDIAHQLRTPLTRLRARLERAARDLDSVDDFRGSTNAALAEIDRLLSTVAALLRIRELEDQARRSRFAPVDLAQVVEDACDLHRPLAEDRGIDLVCEIVPVPIVEGDASLIIEALSNLIDNAMKFGPLRGRVTISLGAEKNRIWLTVTDTGAGVPLEERSLVTQRFYRGRHDQDGAGLGLSLVKAIADLHGFDLVFAANGSAVSIVCPINMNSGS